MSSPTWLICNLDHVIGSLLDETVLTTLMLQRSFTKWLQRFLWDHSSDPSAGVSIARHVSFWWHSLTSQPRLTKCYSRACLPPKSNWPSGKVCWLYKCSSVVNGQRATMKAGTQERGMERRTEVMWFHTGNYTEMMQEVSNEVTINGSFPAAYFV